MEDFVDTLSGAAHDRLAFAIQGRGAFRRFKDAVIKMGLIRSGMTFNHPHISVKRQDGVKRMELNMRSKYSYG